MCGIVGIADFKKELFKDRALIERMAETLAKRGPDDSGEYLSENVLLGHRRLTVIDPVGGAQPMIRYGQGGQYVIVYNGELYNTEELRARLTLEGFTFESYSDTEVLLDAYIAWGAACVNYINGIFAFAIWDEREKSLFLCRDRLGVKPLFYAIRDGALVFASELKALLAHPAVKPIIDEEGVCEIMGLGPAHSLDSGIFKDVYQLPPAHWMRFGRDGQKLHEYWTLQSSPHEQSEEDTQAHVRELLLDAIRRQLVADVPVCTFLSGGLDSSIISAVAAAELKKRGERLRTFSIDYEQNELFYKKTDFTPATDDAFVDIMARTIGSKHTKVILNNADLVTSLSSAVHAMDWPGMADIDSSLWLACRAVRTQATVALSGECADEIFAGYPWYLKPELANVNTFPWSNSVPERQRLLSPALGKVNLNDYVQAQYQKTVDQTPREADGSIDPMKKLFYLNIKWFMTTLLARKDRMSMSNGLEVRVPFADHRLVEYAFNIPAEYMFYNGREKGLLRKSLTGLLPEEVLWRKKNPYPKTFNPEYERLVQSWMSHILQDGNSMIHQMVDRDRVKEIVDTGGRSFGRPWFGQLMTGPQLIAYLIQVELWLQRYNVEIAV